MDKVKKKSFVLYVDQRLQIEMLEDAEVGQLIKAVYRYVDTGEVADNMSRITKILFTGIKAQLDRDEAHYQDVCKKRKEAAESGKQKRANGSKSKQMHTDSDSDSDSDSENDSESESVVCVSHTQTQPTNYPKNAEEVLRWLQSRTDKDGWFHPNNGIHTFKFGDPKDDAEDFFCYYDSQGWIQANGIPVKNWKSKCFWFLKRRHYEPESIPGMNVQH